MWVSILDHPIIKTSEPILLHLLYKDYYGHNPLKVSETVRAVWNKDTDSFYELATGKEIDASEIVQWFKED